MFRSLLKQAGEALPMSMLCGLDAGFNLIVGDGTAARDGRVAPALDVTGDAADCAHLV